MQNRFEIKGDITTIFVKTKGKVIKTIISTSDLEKVRSISGTWGAQWNESVKNYYIFTSKQHKKEKKRIQLHRLITDCPDGLVVDHINHDTLNNTRENLRNVTRLENNLNRKTGLRKARGPKQPIYNMNGKKSGHIGIYWAPRHNSWIVRPKLNGKMHYLGYYKELDEAKKVLETYLQDTVHRVVF